MPPMKKKRCTQCDEVKPLDEYGRNKQAADGRYAMCRLCLAERKRAYYDRKYKGNAEHAARVIERRSQAYLVRLAAQGGVCGCCGRPWVTGTRKFCGDHDHSCCTSSRARDRCGRCERDLLCHKCNIGLSNFDEDPELLRKARQYLRRHQRAVPVSAEGRNDESRRSRPR